MKNTPLHVVRNDRAAAPQVSTVRHVLEIEQPAPVEAPDQIRSIAAWAKAWDLEHAGLRSAVERAGIPTAKIGRAVCVRRSDLLSLVDKLAIEPKPKAAAVVATDYDAICNAAKGRRR